MFQPSGRKPYHGINYVVVHDGFTLRDLYSFLHNQNNQPFPLGPSPGGTGDDGNISWDQGGDPARNDRRREPAWRFFSSRPACP